MENLKENKKFTVEESIELITRGINEVIGLEEIKEKLKERKKLNIKRKIKRRRTVNYKSWV